MPLRQPLALVAVRSLVMLAAAAASTICAAEPAPALQQQWPVSPGHPFHDSLEEGLGFSFVYDGGRVGPRMPEGWQVSTRKTGGGTITELRHPSGLAAIREVRAIPEFAALEYTVRFRNTGKSESPPIRNVNAIDLTFGDGLLAGVSAFTSGGGQQDPAYPPGQFAIQRRYLGQVDPMEGRQHLILSTEGGRSSSKDLPFFFLEHDAPQSGIFVALGWTGQWSVRISADHRNQLLRLTGGMPDIDIRLRPGEEISGPSILLGCYGGPLSAGSNRLRRLLRERYIPQVEGQELPLVLYDTWFNVQCGFDEPMLHDLADAAAEVGNEYFLLDACWYEGTTANPDWTVWEKVSRSLGNWDRPEPDKLPSGLPALAGYVRSKGMKFGLWFEPERIAKDTNLEKAHPDWVLWREGYSWGLLDFGRKEVQDWAINLLDRYIKDTGLRYIRWDFNLSPLPIWEGNSVEGRRGILQIRHIEGLHRVEDWLRENHPEVILESCASGGMRIDLHTIQRRPTIWISDQTVDTRFIRYHLAGLNHFLPGSSQVVAVVKPVLYKVDFDLPDTDFQSHFAGALGFMGRLNEWPPELRKRASEHVAVYKRIRHLLAEDFYLLIPQPRMLGQWEGWQFHNPETQEGFVQIFRSKGSPVPSRTVPLKGLDKDTTYRMTDPYGGERFTVNGAGALTDGVAFDLPEESSRLLIYGPEN